MKYKNLSKEQLLLSIDRLTRFKPTSEKYFRVFSDIITSNLSEPVYKKSDLLKMSSSDITKIAEKIINDSLNSLVLNLNNEYNEKKNIINLILKDYENSVFINDEETQGYLDNKIDYVSFISLIDESCPINLRWLKAILPSPPTPLPKEGNKCSAASVLSPAERVRERVIFDTLVKLRKEKGLKFPIQKVLLVEGITEEILLPAFSKYLGFDFYKEGIQIIPAGGKNQVVKMYYKLINELRIPIFILLDKDAENNISEIMPKLRDTDKIHLVSCGEFEDLLPKSLIVKTVNNELSNFASITEEDLDSTIPEAKNLENIFKTKGFHEFKKAEFAKLVRDNITEDSDISKEISSIVKEIAQNN